MHTINTVRVSGQEKYLIVSEGLKGRPVTPMCPFFLLMEISQGGP